MTGNWLLMILFVVYPMVVVIFNRIIKNGIPCKRSRKEFLIKNEYVNKLLYLMMPVLVLHLELMLYYSGYRFDEINIWILIILGFLQSYVFVASIFCFYQFFTELKTSGEQLSD